MFQNAFIQLIKLIILNHKLLVLVNSMEIKEIKEESVIKVKNFITKKYEEFERFNIKSLGDIIGDKILKELLNVFNDK
jgi:hypothetical protein